MTISFCKGIVLAACVFSQGCSSGSNSGGTNTMLGMTGGSAGSAATPAVGTGGTTVPPGTGGTLTGTGGAPTGTGGMIVVASGGAVSSGGAAGSSSGGASSGGGGASGASGAAGANAGGAAGGGGTAGNGGGGGAGGAGGGTALTGTLGTLGAVKPTVNGWWISNSGETLIYLSSASLTCMQMQTMGAGWLSSVAAGAQVVEIVIKGAPSVKTYPVGLLQGEVNYAPGGMSSAYEVSASSGSITFTKAMTGGPLEGTVMATYPMGSVMGTFHAEFCAMGSQY